MGLDPRDCRLDVAFDTYMFNMGVCKADVVKLMKEILNAVGEL